MTTMRQIATTIAHQYDLTLDDLKAYDRSRRVAWPRQHAMAELRATGRYSFPQIGRFLGGRDHSTVFYGVRRHAERNKSNPIHRHTERVDDRYCRSARAVDNA